MKGIERFVSMPLGIGSVYVPQRKEWIATAIGTVGGLLSSVFGGSAASSASKKALKYQNELYHRNYAQGLRDYNENPLDRDDNQALLTRAEKFNIKNWRREQGAKAVGAGKDAASRRMQDAATQHANAMSQAEQNRAQQITAATQAASNAMMGIGSAVDQATSAKTNLKGGGNNSIEFNPPEVEKTPDVAPQSPMETYNNATDAEREHFRNAIFQ